MQAREIAEPAQRGLRLPAADPAPAAKRATPDERAKRLGTDEQRRPATQQPARMPGNYGAGF